MTSKITLVTPPDFYENSNFSVLFLGISEKEQNDASLWLGQHVSEEHCNFYYYQGENNIPWLMYALNRADITYLNFDENHVILNVLGSYILGKPNVCFTTKDENLKELMSHISTQFVPDIQQFLQRVFNDQK